MDPRFAVPGVCAQSRLLEAAPAILLSKADPLFGLEAAACGGADMEAVHDMRVASRRLREAMRLLAPLYPRREFAEWYGRARRITRSLGPVRDSDVFIDALSRYNRRVGDGGKRAVAFMIGYRMGQREAEVRTLNRELSKLDLVQSQKSFCKLARAPKRNPEARRPLASFAHAAIAERSAAVFGELPNALDEANVLVQHALRIDFKRLRYAVEVFAPCYGDDFDELHDVLTAFQDVLGELHDLHVFMDMLRSPERVAAARRAGVLTSDLGEIGGLLDKRAHLKFREFTRLATKHPVEELLSALLLPLARPAPPEPPDSVDNQRPADVGCALAVSAPAPLAPPAPAPDPHPAGEPAPNPSDDDEAILEDSPKVGTR